jgi:hypothetical protein
MWLHSVGSPDPAHHRAVRAQGLGESAVQSPRLFVLRLRLAATSPSKMSPSTTKALSPRSSPARPSFSRPCPSLPSRSNTTCSHNPWPLIGGNGSGGLRRVGTAHRLKPFRLNEFRGGQCPPWEKELQADHRSGEMSPAVNMVHPPGGETPTALPDLPGSSRIPGWCLLLSRRTALPVVIHGSGPVGLPRFSLRQTPGRAKDELSFQVSTLTQAFRPA